MQASEAKHIRRLSYWRNRSRMVETARRRANCTVEDCASVFAAAAPEVSQGLGTENVPREAASRQEPLLGLAWQLQHLADDAHPKAVACQSGHGAGLAHDCRRCMPCLTRHCNMQWVGMQCGMRCLG